MNAKNVTNIHHNLDQLFDELNTQSTTPCVVVATKYATMQDIHTLSQSKHPIIFGENKVQQGEEKQKNYPEINIPWHFIGHLQRNKVKKIINNYSLIHSVDSIRLLQEIDKQSKQSNLVTKILLQINTAKEQSKFGFSEEEIKSAIDQSHEYKNITITGLMCMAPHTDNHHIIEKTFKKTRNIYDMMKLNGIPVKHLSMGMSNDYKIAIDQGSTMIRVGSIIFK